MTLEVVGWLFAVLLAGLWWGERGRRIDAQWTAQIRSRHTKPPVELPSDDRPPAGLKAFSPEEREKAIQGIAAEGAMDYKTAEMHFDELLHEGWGG